ncbi:hypothetical protein CWI36_1150p0010 [Hamiltosporidium magnivora]|uniref:Uncharacterized protein n=1 Tax=Hamiltosporidium magnivora TaxID=148818 RepID=A0A4Q9L485_9MICR|nr:hypothetical protein CWI36_1150p0010 [Hamiltosporidium magnivora]
MEYKSTYGIKECIETNSSEFSRSIRLVEGITEGGQDSYRAVVLKINEYEITGNIDRGAFLTRKYIKPSLDWN